MENMQLYELFQVSGSKCCRYKSISHIFKILFLVGFCHLAQLCAGQEYTISDSTMLQQRMYRTLMHDSCAIWVEKFPKQLNEICKTFTENQDSKRHLLDLYWHIYRQQGSPTYMKITNMVSTTMVFGLLMCKLGIFAVVRDCSTVPLTQISCVPKCA